MARAPARLMLAVFAASWLVQSSTLLSDGSLQRQPAHRHARSSLTRLRAAEASVRAAEPRAIAFPSARVVRSLAGGDTERQFDGMMFAGGAQQGGRESFAARICTSGCVDQSALGLFSTVIVGELASPKGGADALTWTQASLLKIPHNRTGLFVGPEDPRLDIVNGSRFVLANVNVDVAGCPPKEHAYENPRHMFFAPVDAIPGARACHIQLEGADPCGVQKNWAPLVPRHSQDIYFAYSLSPLRVLRFDRRACAASFAGGAQRHAPAAGPGDVHGGTRFVHGLAVPEGDVYFAIGHTAPPGYKQVLVAVLMQRPGAHRVEPIMRSGSNNRKSAEMTQDHVNTRMFPEARLSHREPTFHLVGVSCPIDLEKSTAASRGNPMMITTSIISFDPDADLARITFQKHETQNYQTELHGISSWLQTAYHEFRNDGPVSCRPTG